MGKVPKSAPHIRFGPFTANLTTGELHKRGVRIRLSGQAFRVLAMLLDRPGEMLARDEIQSRLWPNNTIVEFDHLINTAINRIRQALNDSAEAPRYIETLPRRGYRFIASVESSEPLLPMDRKVDVPRTPGNAEVSELPEPSLADSSESLAGRQVSHYRIEAKVAEGGMGVIYRAVDIRLGRSVALKFLPEGLVSSSSARERFRLEAHAASLLSHPNIATIYEVEEHDGTPFIVMELLEGQTLQERIAEPLGPADLPQGREQENRRLMRGARVDAPFEASEIVEVALQLVDALAAAHEAGLIHRDLKPANIFITNRGHVKVLDFSLAKLERVGRKPKLVAAGAPDDSSSPHLTSPGIAVGTAAYMSPEQARGEEIDSRSDIFSFGSVLYEMATGRQAFPGETSAVVFDALLNRSPVLPRQLNPALPSELERIIGRMMEKDRELRYQTVSALEADLGGLRASLRSTTGAANVVQRSLLFSGTRSRSVSPRLPRPAAVESLPVSATPASLPSWKLIAICGCLAAVVAVAAYLSVRHSGSPQPTMRQLTFSAPDSGVTCASLSPDGRYVAYSDPNGLYLYVIASGEIHLLPQPPGFRTLSLSWFPDGARLAVTESSREAGGSNLWMVPILGGVPVKLLDHVAIARVSPGGKEIAFVGDDRTTISIVTADGEDVEPLISAGVEGGVFQELGWYPNGRSLALLRAESRAGTDNIELLALNSHQPSIIEAGFGIRGFCVLPDAGLIYAQNEELWRAAPGVKDDRDSQHSSRIIRLVGGRPGSLTLSSDGKRLAFLQVNVQEPLIQVSELSADGTTLRDTHPLTHDARQEYPHAWTADSRSVLFESNQGIWKIYSRAVDGAISQALAPDANAQYSPRLSPDGRSILYNQAPAGAAPLPSAAGRLMRVPLVGGAANPVVDGWGDVDFRCPRAPATLCVLGRKDQGQFRFYSFNPLALNPLSSVARAQIAVVPTKPDDWDLSPDGRRIAWVPHNSTDGKISIVYLALNGRGPNHQRVVEVEGRPPIRSINWSADGTGWFISSRIANDSTLLHVNSRGKATVLVQHAGTVSWAVPSPDGRYLAYTMDRNWGNLWLMDNFP